MKLLSVNLGRRTTVEYTDAADGRTAIDKKPTAEPVLVTAPGVKGVGGSGLAGDEIGNKRHHGGHDQAVYVFAREDLDTWESLLGRPLANGGFGENLTTSGIDVNGARIGERWRIGGSGPLLEVTSSRIPCRTFQGHLGEKAWVKRFTQHGVPGAYLRVIEPGEIRAGDTVEIAHRPAHDVTVALHFRAITTERSLLPRMLAAGAALHPETIHDAREYVEKYGTGE
ncbi:MOSC domain-containing protein [Streptomyces sp. NPDC087300]|uniref:MOSC domain-containing protein n=1 Tax=Streptomyces sp. NPDC087300 TaxID=3365780 RepID=UPI00381FD28E